LNAQVSFAEGKIATEAKIEVNGMVCGFCAQGITKKFKAEREVATVDVKLEEKAVTLKFKEGEELSNEKITQTLKDAGYTVEKIERK